MRDNMLITVTLKDKRRTYGHNVKYFHEDSITPEIYNFVKKNRAKIINIQYHFDKMYCYYHRSKPSIDDFLEEYKGVYRKKKPNMKTTHKDDNVTINTSGDFTGDNLIKMEGYIDTTGIKLTPSPNGEKCEGNGTGKTECCCDECDHYLICFPQNGKNEGKTK